MMKKIIIPILAVLAVYFTSCNPNEEVYKHLDSLRSPYSEHFDYKLTDDDYTTMKSLALQVAQNAQDSADANTLGSLKHFTDSISAAKYVPMLLASKFIALDSGSSIVINYDVSHQYVFTDDNIFDSGDTAEIGNPNDYDTLITIANPSKGAKALVTYTGATYGNDTTYETAYALYVYDGTAWQRPDDAFEMTYANYEEIGTATGTYHNFSSSATPEFYLPVYLKLKFPYSAAGDTYELIYRYYSSGTTSIIYDVWYFDGTNWANLENRNDQFINGGNGWVFDPTVKLTMGYNEYQAIVDWVKSQDSISAYAPYPNTEYYFGASTYHGYNDFDMRVATRVANDPNGYLAGLSDDQVLDILWSRIPKGIEIALESVYPDQQPFVNGVQVYYIVTFKTYEPGDYFYTIKFKCTDVGKFEYVEGPTPIQ